MLHSRLEVRRGEVSSSERTENMAGLVAQLATASAQGNQDISHFPMISVSKRVLKVFL